MADATSFKLCSRAKFKRSLKNNPHTIVEMPLWNISVRLPPNGADARSLAVAHADGNGRFDDVLREVRLDVAVDDALRTTATDTHQVLGVVLDVVGAVNRTLRLKGNSSDGKFATALARFPAEEPLQGTLVAGAIPVRGSATRFNYLLKPITHVDDAQIVLRPDSIGLVWKFGAGADDQVAADLRSTPAGELELVAEQDISGKYPPLAQLLAALGMARSASLSNAWIAWRWRAPPIWSSLARRVELGTDGRNNEVTQPGPANAPWLLDPAILELSLRDQPAQSALRSRSDFALRPDRIAVSEGTPIALTVSSGVLDPADVTLEYTQTDGTPAATYTDVVTVKGESWRIAERNFDRLRDLRGDAKRAFLPIASGWLQLDLPYPSRVAAAATPGGGSAALDPGAAGDWPAGLWSIGTRRPERETDAVASAQLPWALEMDAVSAWQSTLELKNTPRAVNTRIATDALRLRGLLWLGVGQATDEDLLPAIELGSRSLRDLVMELVPAVYAGGTLPAWHFDVAEKSPPTVAMRNWSPGATAWPVIESASGTLTPHDRALVVAWQRHPTLPAVQLMPMTAATSAPVVPPGSREFVPMKLEQGAVALDIGTASWPVMPAPGAGSFWWPADAPPEITTWNDLPHVVAGVPLAALSMPGIELWPTGALPTFRPAYRFDLPYSDEMHARARPPRPSTEAPPVEPVLPDVVLAQDEAIRQHWTRQHDAWMLSLGSGALLTARTDAATNGGALLPGCTWQADVAVEDALSANGFGTVRITDAATKTSLTLRGDTAVAGGNGSVAVDGGAVSVDFSASSAPFMLGWSLPMLRVDSGNLRLDGHGIAFASPLPWGTTEIRVQLVQRRDLRAPNDFHRVTLAAPIAFRSGVLAFDFYCRDLPCALSGGNLVFPSTQGAPLDVDHAWSLSSIAAKNNAGLDLLPMRLLSVEMRPDGGIDLSVEMQVTHLEGDMPRVVGSGRVDLKRAADGTAAISSGRITLLLPLPEWNRRADGTRRSARDPWFEPDLQIVDGTLSWQDGTLHLPLLGDWTTLKMGFVPARHAYELKPDAGAAPIATFDAPLLQLLSLRFDITALDAVSLSASVDLGVAGFRFDYAQAEKTSVATGLSALESKIHMFLLRAPGLDGTGAGIAAEFGTGFDPFGDSGLAVVASVTTSAAGAPYEIVPGFSLAEAKGQVGIGVTFASVDGRPRIGSAYVEGELVAKDSNSVFAYSCARDASGQTAHAQTRIFLRGNWSLASTLRWPSYDPTPSPGRLVTPFRKHRLRFAFDGQWLPATRLGCDARGSVSWSTAQDAAPTAVRTLNTIEREDGTVALSFGSIQPFHIGTLRDLKAALALLAAQTLTDLTPLQDVTPLTKILGGMVTEKFRKVVDSLADKHGDETVVWSGAIVLLGTTADKRLGTPVALPALCGVGASATVGEALAKVSFNDDEVSLLSAAAMDQSLSDLVFDLEPAPTFRPQMPATDSLVPARWERDDRRLGSDLAVDAGTTVVQQHRRVNFPNLPFLRVQALLARANEAKGAAVSRLENAAVRGGDWHVYAPADIAIVAPRASAFAAKTLAVDLVAGGGSGLTVVEDRGKAYESQPKLLRNQLLAQAGRPGFALRRTFHPDDDDAHAAALAAMPSVGSVVPGPRDSQRLAAGDVADPARYSDALPTPVCDGNGGALLDGTNPRDYRPLALGGTQAVTGVRHWMDAPIIAAAPGDGARYWRAVRDQVRFAAPRPLAVIQSPVASAWPARQRLPPVAADDAQCVLAIATEVASFASRGGVMHTHREAVLEAPRPSVLPNGESSAAPLRAWSYSSTPTNHRAPRALALPEARRTLAHADARSCDAWSGSADVVFDRSGTTPQAYAVVRLTTPGDGILRPDWDGRLTLTVTSSAAGFPITTRILPCLILDGRRYPLSCEALTNPGTTFTLELKLQQNLALPDDRDVQGELVVRFVQQVLAEGSGPVPSVLVEPACSVALRICRAAPRGYGLPLQAATVWYTDPVYNDSLGSEIGFRDVGGNRLSTDRQAYNANSPLTFMVSTDAVVRFRRLRAEPLSGALVTTELLIAQAPMANDSPVGRTAAATVPANQPVKIDLVDLAPEVLAVGEPALQGGDMLQISAAVGTAKPVEILLPIAVEPVLAPPTSAYALWMNDDGKRVGCPRFGWGVMPNKIELVDPLGDLTRGRVRRVAAFNWQVVLPRWQKNVGFFVQRIDHVGATHYPSDADPLREPLK